MIIFLNILCYFFPVFLIEEGQEHFVEWLNQSTSSIPVENFSLESYTVVVNHDESDHSLSKLN